jgi:hypothetical protein
MDPKKIANLYYDAWMHRAGDMTDVPLAADFSFRGPVASFDDAAGDRQMAAQAGRGGDPSDPRWSDRARRADLRRGGAAQGHAY